MYPDTWNKECPVILKWSAELVCKMKIQFFLSVCWGLTKALDIDLFPPAQFYCNEEDEISNFSMKLNTNSYDMPYQFLLYLIINSHLVKRLQTPAERIHNPVSWITLDLEGRLGIQGSVVNGSSQECPSQVLTAKPELSHQWWGVAIMVSSLKDKPLTPGGRNRIYSYPALKIISCVCVEEMFSLSSLVKWGS